MKLDKRQLNWIRENEQVITSILEQRISDLKDLLLEAPEDKRDAVIRFIKEYKTGLGFIKELNQDKKTEDFTGI